MKKILGLLAMLILGFKLVLSQTMPLADPTLPGIVLISENIKTNVFEIKLKDLQNAVQARALDAQMLSKQGILSSLTDGTTHVCRVEVLKAVTEQRLRELLHQFGYTVSKTFTE